MNNPFFTGCCTALVTPFLDQKVNYPMLEQLLQKQLLAGLEATLVCGTTGESATLTDDEILEIIRRAKAAGMKGLTAEGALHHLLYTHEDVGVYDTTF